MGSRRPNEAVETRIDRRTVCARLGTVAAVVSAGCLSFPGTGDGPTSTVSESATPPSSPTEGPSPTRTRPPTATPSPTPSPTPHAAVSVDAGPDGALRFEPRTFAVTAGEPVEWVFRSIGHNAKPTSIPEDSSWPGTPGDEFTTVPAGFVHRHTFETTGTYEYVCVPHRSAGMVGSFTVDP